MQCVGIDTLVVIYTHYYFNESVRADLDAADIATLQSEVEKSKRFLWRASNLKCLMETDYLIVDRTLTTEQLWEFTPGGGDYWLPFWSKDGGASSVEQDIYAAGIEDGDYSVILVLYAFEGCAEAGAAIGGGAYGVEIGCMGDAGYIGIPLAWGLNCEGVISHEYCHVLDSIFEHSGNPGGNNPHHTDQPASFPALIDCHRHFMFLIHNLLDPSAWLLLDPAWATVRTETDGDEDGVPDSGNLPITEASLGTRGDDPDTDDDDLGDLEEMTATYYRESDPLVRDSDGDGIPDGWDQFPLVAFNYLVAQATPSVDGEIEPGEYAWIRRCWQGADISGIVYTRWSDGVLYVAAEVNDDVIRVYYPDSQPWGNDNFEIRIDAEHDGWESHGDQNYRFFVLPKGPGGIADVVGHYSGRAPGETSWAWNEIDVSEVTARYSIHAGGYTVEAAIPVSVMPGVNVGLQDVVRLTFYRVREGTPVVLPPAPDELTERRARWWMAGATRASATITDSTTHVQAGSESLLFATDGGYDTWFSVAAVLNAGWDLAGSGVASLTFWVYAENLNPYGFQNNSPWIRFHTTPTDYIEVHARRELLNAEDREEIARFVKAQH